MALISKYPATTTLRVFFSLLILLVISVDAIAGGVGIVLQLQGSLSVERIDGTHALLNAQSEINQGDLLITGKNSFAGIRFADESTLSLRPDTTLKVQDFKFTEIKPESDSVILKLIKGGLRKVSGLIGKRSQPKDILNTPIAQIGIRGTDYSLQFCKNDCREIRTQKGMVLAEGLHVEVDKGRIILQNQAGSQLVNAGQLAYVKDEKTAPVIAAENDDKLHYPADPANILKSNEPPSSGGGSQSSSNDISIPIIIITLLLVFIFLLIN